MNNKSFDTKYILYFSVFLTEIVKILDIYLMLNRLVKAFLPLLIHQEEITEV
jgi:hypothetical protein